MKTFGGFWVHLYRAGGISSPRVGVWATALLLALLMPARAGATLFDFDSAPIHSTLPADLTVEGVTAHFAATGSGMSFQPANTMGFTPAGFAGLCLYPNSVFASDLTITFSVLLSDFSILYAPQELGCDDSAIMRVTAYVGGVLRGTATATAPAPGTWPTGTLSYSDPAGFDQVVVHYDQRPRCTDSGPIFMADNMTVAMLTTSAPPAGAGRLSLAVSPNPFRDATVVSVQAPGSGPFTVTVHDAAGRRVRTLAGASGAGGRFTWDGLDDAGRAVLSGVYFLRVTTAQGVRTTPVILRR